MMRQVEVFVLAVRVIELLDPALIETLHLLRDRYVTPYRICHCFNSNRVARLNASLHSIDIDKSQ